jgi:DNA-binding CsgD family transcriptional regulator
MLDANTEKLALYLKFVQESQHVKTEPKFKELLVELCKYLGMDGLTWMYGVYPHYRVIDTRPVAWLELYVRESMEHADPILHGSALVGRGAMVWSRYLEGLKLGPKAQSVMRLSKKYGLNDGVLFPAYGKGPIKAGLSFFTASDDQAGIVADTHERSLDLISDHCVVISERVYATYHQEVEGQALTEKPRNLLMTIIHSPTHKEAAARIGISPETVKTQLADIKAKLGVTSIYEAIGVAMNRGEISW